MDNLISTLKSVNVDPGIFLKAALILVFVSVALACIGRFAFGKNSVLSRSVSSAIGILFVYTLAIVINSAVPALMKLIPSLPFAKFETNQVVLFTLQGSHYTDICSHILSMIILSFVANLLDWIIPDAKNFFLWLLAKVITVIGAIALLHLVNWLIIRFLPSGILTYAPVILLALLVLLLLVGLLKHVVGAVLSSINPLIAAFYTFFFSTIVGKALTKAIFTTAILTAIVYGLGVIGCAVISIASAALLAYIPLLIVLILIWYLLNRFL